MTEYPPRKRQVREIWDICECGHYDFNHEFPSGGRYIINSITGKNIHDKTKCETCLCPSYTKGNKFTVRYTDGSFEEGKEE